MSIAISILSAVLKSVVNSKIENELASDIIGISIDGISEKGINTISNYIDKEKAKIKYILSKKNMISMNIPEENIDYVVAEIKDLLSKVKITDKVFRQYKYNSMDLSGYLLEKYRAYKGGNIECESDVKNALFSVADAIIKLLRDSEEFEKDFLIQISNSVDDTNAEIQKISEYMKENFSKLDDNSQMVLNILWMILELIQNNMQCNDTNNINDEDKRFQNNKKEDYIKIWNSRLFLHQDNDERPITLEDAFIMPDYKIEKSVNRIGFNSNDTLDKVIEKYIEYDKTSTMLITGVPGIGKSSITSWIANEYKDDDRCIVLRFRDWEVEELDRGLLKAVCNTLECKRNELESKILILDGFDEIKTLDIRHILLNTFLSDIKDYENFKCIMTSRPPYVDSQYINYFENVIRLHEFDICKVDIFYKTITGKSLEKKDKIELNLEVLGIPVILYMAIMSNIDISENPTKPELYNRIFAEKGGIFDRFNEEGKEYGTGVQILRNPENIKKYLDFLQKTAFVMFENDSLSIEKKDCEIPELKFQGEFVSVLEFPVKHLFDEVEKNSIEFIHKSIYEYFVSEYLFTNILDMINTNKTKEQLASTLAKWMYKGSLPIEICDFLQYKIAGKLINNFDVIFETFQIMLQNGMSYYIDKRNYNVIDSEMNIFVNMLDFLHLWEDYNLKFDESIYRYFMLNNIVTTHRLNLKKVNFNFMNMQRMNFANADLTEAQLYSVNISDSTLENAILRGADLKRANLKRVDFKNADLKNADLQGTVLYDVNLYGADLDNSIWQMGDIKQVCLQLKDTNFKHIIITSSNGREKLSRSEFFDKFYH